MALYIELLVVSLRMVSPRERMVISAALLIRERGAHATAVSDVLRHSRAPRGSAYHYFPEGRSQLLAEAIEYAGKYAAALIEVPGSAVEVLDRLIAAYRDQLLSTDFRAGCPVVAVTVEAGGPKDHEQMAPLIDRAGTAFARWRTLIAQRCVDDGVAAARADELAVLVIAAFEGAILMARAARDIAPIDTVHRQLRSLLAGAVKESS